MNKIILVGRLSKEPELSYTQGGTAVCKFSIAIDRDFKRDGVPSADFFNIVVWGKLGENCAKYLAKGREAAVSGRLENRSWDGDDGKKRYATDVIADNVQFIGGSKQEQSAEYVGIDVEVDDDCPF